VSTDAAPTAWERLAAALAAEPHLTVAVGALAISANAVLIDLAETSTATASFYRCAIAVPVLAALAWSERARNGPVSRRQRMLAVAAGVFFAGDMLLWTQAIFEVGAGLSTVLVNAQVAIVPLLALFIDREPLAGRYLVALPFMIVGIVLTGGLLESGLAGTDPVLGTVHAVLAGVCYSGFLYLLRRGGREGSQHLVQTFRDVIVTTAIVSVVVGPWWHGIDFAPGWSAIAWLAGVAVCGPIVGWMLIAIATPRLSSHASAALLLLTPAGSLVMGAVVLGERPSALQLVGCAVMLASAYAAASADPV
jgi:drug/metabolite transporter (DMT)-like permease